MAEALCERGCCDCPEDGIDQNDDGHGEAHDEDMGSGTQGSRSSQGGGMAQGTNVSGVGGGSGLYVVGSVLDGHGDDENDIEMGRCNTADNGNSNNNSSSSSRGSGSNRSPASGGVEAGRATTSSQPRSTSSSSSSSSSSRGLISTHGTYDGNGQQGNMAVQLDSTMTMMLSSYVPSTMPPPPPPSSSLPFGRRSHPNQQEEERAWDRGEDGLTSSSQHEMSTSISSSASAVGAGNTTTAEPSSISSGSRSDTSGVDNGDSNTP